MKPPSTRVVHTRPPTVRGRWFDRVMRFSSKVRAHSVLRAAGDSWAWTRCVGNRRRRGIGAPSVGLFAESVSKRCATEFRRHHEFTHQLHLPSFEGTLKRVDRQVVLASLHMDAADRETAGGILVVQLDDAY